MPAVLEVVDVSRFWKESSVTPPPEMEKSGTSLVCSGLFNHRLVFPVRVIIGKFRRRGHHTLKPAKPFSQNWELGNTFKAESMEACSCGWSFW